MKTALIDGDILLYKCGFAAEKTYYEIYEEGNEEFGWVAKYRSKKEAKEYCSMYGDGFIMVPIVDPSPVSHALSNVDNLVNYILDRLGTNKREIFLTGEGNYRDKIATILPYKGNRDPSHKPFHYKTIKEYLINRYSAKIVNGMEADDALGIEQWGRGMKGQTVICSIDKDLNMIPGYHFNWDKDKFYEIFPDEGYSNFFGQVLQGDSTDNIPGLYKITGVKCTKDILEPLQYLKRDEMRRYVEEIYLRHRGYIPSEQIVKTLDEIMRLLWISRTRPNDLEEFVYG